MRLFLLFTVFLLTACTTTSTSTNQVLVLTDQDNNKTLELTVGQRFTVQLKENPTTGYQWAIDAESDKLSLEQDEYVLDKMPDFNGQRIVGGGGTRTFIFAVKKSGPTTLKLKHWRFWEKDSSIVDRFVVNIEAQ